MFVLFLKRQSSSLEIIFDFLLLRRVLALLPFTCVLRHTIERNDVIEFSLLLPSYTQIAVIISSHPVQASIARKKRFGFGCRWPSGRTSKKEQEATRIARKRRDSALVPRICSLSRFFLVRLLLFSTFRHFAFHSVNTFFSTSSPTENRG